MRTVSALRKSMTDNEWNRLREAFVNPLLYSLLAESGYDVMKMQKVKYATSELKDRVIASIHRDKLEIQDLKKEVENEKDSYIKNLDTMFTTLRKLKGKTL